MSQIIEVYPLANMHSHLREGERIKSALVKISHEAGTDSILYMPNTEKGLLTVHHVKVYGQDLEKWRRWEGSSGTMNFIPTVMINERTTLDMIDECVDEGIEDGKGYPLDRTTKSHHGIRRYGAMLPGVRHCGKKGMRVHVHPEHPQMLFDNRDAEFAFLPIVEMFLQETEAVIIWEHGTDARCIPFWKEFAKTGRFFLTLTAHHLVSDEDQSFGDVRAICKPPIKTRRDRIDLVRLVEEDLPWVMAGLDDAPHPQEKKHISSGNCACGAFTTPFGHQLYAHALSNLLSKPNGLDVYRNFTSHNARVVYGLPDPSRMVILEEKPFTIPLHYQVGDWIVESFWAGRTLDYSIRV